MTDQSVISGGNLLSTLIYGGTLVADEEAALHEAWRVATGRRSPYTNYYESITANQQRTITRTHTRTRTADLFVLDRGHNLAGKEVILECADVSDFSSAQVVFDIVLPSATAPGSLDDALGVRSEEGAWYKRFPDRAAFYWRLRIPAMGASQKPKIVGAHLSLSYSFDPWRPMNPDQDELGGEASESDAGWPGMGTPWNRRTDALRVQLSTLFDYDPWRDAYQHFQRYRPTWYIPNEDQAQNAMCIARPQGVAGLGRTPQWFGHQGDIPYVEYEAA